MPSGPCPQKPLCPMSPVLLQKWTGPPRTFGLSSQIVADNRLATRAIHNVPTEHTLNLLVSSHPLESTMASNTCRYCSQLVTSANFGTFVDVNVICLGRESRPPASEGIGTKPSCHSGPAVDVLPCPSKQHRETKADPVFPEQHAGGPGNLGQQNCPDQRRTNLNQL